jgi:hypothetical protein
MFEAINNSTSNFELRTFLKPLPVLLFIVLAKFAGLDHPPPVLMLLIPLDRLA